MTCKDCLYYDACGVIYERTGYTIDGRGIDEPDKEKKCWVFQEASDWGVILHGDWTREAACSECGADALYNSNEEPVASKYCPYCGARMDGDSYDV